MRAWSIFLVFMIINSNIIDVSGDELIVKHKDPVLAVKWVNDGQYLISTSQVGLGESVIIWDSETRNVSGNVEMVIDQLDNFIIFSLDEFIDQNGDSLIVTGHVGKYDYWNFATSNEGISFQSNNMTNNILQQSAIFELEFNPSQIYFPELNANITFALAAGFNLTIIDFYAQTVLQSFLHQGTIENLSWNADGSLITTTRNGFGIYFWNVTSSELVYFISVDGTSVTDWRKTANNKNNIIAIAQRNATTSFVELWDYNQKLILQTQFINKTTRGNPTDIKWNKDGTRLAVSFGKEIYIYNYPAFNEIIVLQGHNDTINTIDWKNERILASGGDDRNVIIWDTDTGEPYLLYGVTNDILDVNDSFLDWFRNNLQIILIVLLVLGIAGTYFLTNRKRQRLKKLRRLDKDKLYPKDNFNDTRNT